jgi:hypothetical protein
MTSPTMIAQSLSTKGFWPTLHGLKEEPRGGGFYGQSTGYREPSFKSLLINITQLSKTFGISRSALLKQLRDHGFVKKPATAACHGIIWKLCGRAWSCYEHVAGPVYLETLALHGWDLPCYHVEADMSWSTQRDQDIDEIMRAGDEPQPPDFTWGFSE